MTIKSRAVDDSGNLEAPGAGTSVTIAAQACPCTIWPASATPGTASDSDSQAVNLGVKFTAERNGSITGIRFYKGSGNTGTHIGNGIVLTAGHCFITSWSVVVAVMFTPLALAASSL